MNFFIDDSKEHNSRRRKALRNSWGGTSLAVQWLRLRLPMQGVRVQSLVGDLVGSHMPRGQKMET